MVHALEVRYPVFVFVLLVTATGDVETKTGPYRIGLVRGPAQVDCRLVVPMILAR
jgi:hypothetical protein